MNYKRIVKESNYWEVLMDYSWFWKTFVIFFVGKFILKIGGRKAISQMTITQIIVMIGIGNILIQPIADNKVSETLFVSLFFTCLMVVTEFIEVKSDLFEKISSGKAQIIIQEGQPVLKNLKKLRMTIDRLETRLRQEGITAIEDVKYATIEVNGQLGYELKEEKKPLTKEDFITIMGEIADLKKLLEGEAKNQERKKHDKNIFVEVLEKSREGNKREP